MMATGTVKSFNPAKGYGFIKTAPVERRGSFTSRPSEAGLADLLKARR